MKLAIAVCVPKEGRFDLRKIRDHVDECDCRRRHPLYKVLCGEYDAPAGETEQRALQCAQGALIRFEGAIIGIGFDRGQKVFYHNNRPIITAIAAAALIIRKKPDKAKVYITTPGDGANYAEDILALCQGDGFATLAFGEKPIMEQAILNALHA